MINIALIGVAVQFFGVIIIAASLPKRKKMWAALGFGVVVFGAFVVFNNISL